MYGSNYPFSEIYTLTRLGSTSLIGWCAVYQTAGFAGLADGRVGGNCAKLTAAQRVELRLRLETCTPRQFFGSTAHTTDGQFWTVEDLQHAIMHWWDVTYASRSSYYNFIVYVPHSLNCG